MVCSYARGHRIDSQQKQPHYDGCKMYKCASAMHFGRLYKTQGGQNNLGFTYCIAPHNQITVLQHGTVERNFDSSLNQLSYA